MNHEWAVETGTEVHGRPLPRVMWLDQMIPHKLPLRPASGTQRTPLCDRSREGRRNIGVELVEGCTCCLMPRRCLWLTHARRALSPVLRPYNRRDASDKWCRDFNGGKQDVFCSLGIYLFLLNCYPIVPQKYVLWSYVAMQNLSPMAIWKVVKDRQGSRSPEYQ